MLYRQRGPPFWVNVLILGILFPSFLSWTIVGTVWFVEVQDKTPFCVSWYSKGLRAAHAIPFGRMSLVHTKGVLPLWPTAVQLGLYRYHGVAHVNFWFSYLAGVCSHFSCRVTATLGSSLSG